MSENQELVTVTPQSQEVTTYQDDPAPLKITDIILVQPTTQKDTKGAKAGQFLDELFGEAYDSVEVVPLKIVHQRVLFPPNEGGSANLGVKPLCRSNDGIVPSKFVETPESAKCKTCPRSQWKRRVNGTPIRPECQDKIKLLVVVRNTMLPRWFQFSGTSITSWESVYEAIRQQRKVREAVKKEQTALYQYSFTISSTEIKGAKGKYYIARFSDIRQIANPSDFGPLYEQYVVRANQVEEEDEHIIQNEAKMNNAVNNVVEAEVVEV